MSRRIEGLDNKIEQQKETKLDFVDQKKIADRVKGIFANKEGKEGQEAKEGQENREGKERKEGQEAKESKEGKEGQEAKESKEGKEGQENDEKKSLFDKIKDRLKGKEGQEAKENQENKGETRMEDKEREEFLARIKVSAEDLKKPSEQKEKTEKKTDSGDDSKNSEGYERTRGGDAYFRRFHEYDDTYSR